MNGWPWTAGIAYSLALGSIAAFIWALHVMSGHETFGVESHWGGLGGGLGGWHLSRPATAVMIASVLLAACLYVASRPAPPATDQPAKPGTVPSPAPSKGTPPAPTGVPPPPAGRS